MSATRSSPSFYLVRYLYWAFCQKRYQSLTPLVRSCFPRTRTTGALEQYPPMPGGEFLWLPAETRAARRFRRVRIMGLSAIRRTCKRWFLLQLVAQSSCTVAKDQPATITGGSVSLGEKAMTLDRYGCSESTEHHIVLMLRYCADIVNGFLLKPEVSAYGSL